MNRRLYRDVLGLFKIRDIVLISAFAGLYLAYGYVSSVALPQPITHSADLFFLIAALFTILAFEVRQSWSATLLGTVTGLIFLGTPGAPAPYHITAALIGNGVVFDVYLRFMNRRTTPPTRLHIISAAILGNLVMAIIGLSALQFVGPPLPLYLWEILVVANALLGAVGALFGIAVVRRIRVSAATTERSLSIETSPVHQTSTLVKSKES